MSMRERGVVLVTGGAGFIGSHVAEELLQRGYEVVILDNLFLGSLDNVRELQEKFSERLHFYEGDVLDSLLLVEVVRKHEVEAIVHEAAMSSMPMHYPDPRRAIRVNLEGFLNVLEVARRFDVPKVVYASTSSIYSACTPPHREDMPVRPRTFYEFVMLAREQAASIYYDYYGIECVGLRYFSIYGPREQHKGRYANVISQFIWKILRGEQPTIYGDGSQTRDFTFVKDVVKANILAMEKNVEGVFNVATGKRVSINELANLIMEITGVKLEPIYDKPRPGDIRHSLADISLAMEKLGYKPEYDLRRGLEVTIRWFSKNLRRS